MGYPDTYGRADRAPSQGEALDSDDSRFDWVDFLQAWRDGRFATQVVEPDKIIDWVPTLAAGGHDADDVIAETEEIPYAMRVNGGTARLQAITVNDVDDEGLQLELIFFDREVSVGAEGATVDTGANGAAVLAHLIVPSTGYSDYASSQTAVPSIQPFLLRSAADSRSIWCAVVARDAATSLTTEGLTIRLHLQRN